MAHFLILASYMQMIWPLKRKTLALSQFLLFLNLGALKIPSPDSFLLNYTRFHKSALCTNFNSIEPMLQELLFSKFPYFDVLHICSQSPAAISKINITWQNSWLAAETTLVGPGTSCPLKSAESYDRCTYVLYISPLPSPNLPVPPFYPIDSAKTKAPLYLTY